MPLGQLHATALHIFRATPSNTHSRQQRVFKFTIEEKHPELLFACTESKNKHVTKLEPPCTT